MASKAHRAGRGSAVRSVGAGTVKAAVVAPGLDEAWIQLRQGSRNVAGVAWQVAVTAHLIVASAAGELPFIEFTPEGLEDVDCTDSGGQWSHIQMKETGAGAGRLTAADVADVLDHADSPTAPDGVIVLVTDGQLGSDLTVTGWDRFVVDQAEVAVEAVLGHLMKEKKQNPKKPDDPIPPPRTRPQAERLLARARIVQLPWGLRGATESLLADALSVHPAVASFAVTERYERLKVLSADQREKATRLDAGTFALGDLDSLVADVQSVVDVEGLESAVREGVCAPADYLHTSGVTGAQFYAGLEGAPAHIGLRLDILRPREMAAIVNAVDRERYALIVGPSGAGKSVLLWRAARDAVGGARVVRVLRLSTPADVEALVRHCRLLRPSEHATVVIAVDNLGRPATVFWPEALDRLRELPYVLLLGAARAEDFDPALVRGGARIVEPQLDADTATYLAEQIELAGITLYMDASEATTRSEGLLMEFIALLTTGQRLEQVLADQVQSLRGPGRELQRKLARLVTAAHSVGIPIPARSLPQAVGLADDGDAVGDALAVLRDEYMLVRDGADWIGLHELRSTTITRLLHASPPPQLGDTYSQVAAVVPPESAAWLLRRAAEQLTSYEMVELAGAAARRLGTAHLDARDMAVLLEGAERADNMLYAKVCLPLLRRELRPPMTLQDFARTIYGIRNQGLADEPSGVARYDFAMSRMREIADQLPERDAPVTRAVVAELDDDRLRQLIAPAGRADTVRLLEALDGIHRITDSTAAWIFTQFDRPGDVNTANLYSRLIRTLTNLAGLESHQVKDAFGDVLDRAKSVLTPDRAALTVANPEPHLITATIMQLLNPDPLDTTIVDWEIGRPKSGSDTEVRAIGTRSRLLDACPEIETIEVITQTPSGRRFIVGDLEFGHKQFSRQQHKLTKVSVRRSVGFQAAVSRLVSGSTWTELVRSQVQLADQLVGLLEQSPIRLGIHDGARHRQQWLDRAIMASEQAAVLVHRPVTSIYNARVSNAQADDDERGQDATSAALAALATALPRILEEDNLRAVSSTLADCVDKIEKARDNANPHVSELGHPLPEKLSRHAAALADLLIAVDLRPDLAEKIRAKDIDRISREIVRTASETQQQTTLEVLGDLTARVEGVGLHEVFDTDALSSTLADRAWIIAVPQQQWQMAVQALQALPYERRVATSGSVIIIAVDGDQALPLILKLNTASERPAIPMLPDMVATLIQQTPFTPPIVDPASELGTLYKDLLDCSCDQALGRRRELDTEESASSASDALVSIRERMQSLSPSTADQTHLASVLMMLFDHVEQEFSGEDIPKASGVVLDGLNGQWAPTIDESDVANMVSFIGLNLPGLT